MKLKTMSVSDLNTYIKRNFDNDFILGNLSVVGEVSNFKAHYSGHLYFSLKDENSKINCVMFKSEASKLKVELRDGKKIIGMGRISVYVKEGTYQFYLSKVEELGIGALHMEFERIKEQLLKEGLFSDDIKRSIPRYPDRIAVITSSTGAAIHDIINVATRRNPKVEIVIYPAIVQGKESPASLVSALRKVNERDDIDVIILGRGGGSFEDLFSFNDLALAYEIRRSKIPVVTGIGHEVDFTIADFVADFRAATPSQAAEVVVPSIVEMEESYQARIEEMGKAVRNLLAMHRERLVARNRSLLRNNPKVVVANEYVRIEEKRHHLDGIIIQKLENEKLRLRAKHDLLNAYSPVQVFSKGYALVYGESGKVLKQVGELDRESRIRIRLSDGERVLKIER